MNYNLNHKEMTDEERVMFNNCIIRYKSGDGESFIENVYDRETKKPILLTNDLTQELEEQHDYTIREHDHDRHIGYGRIVITNGRVTEETYQESND